MVVVKKGKKEGWRKGEREKGRKWIRSSLEDQVTEEPTYIDVGES